MAGKVRVSTKRVALSTIYEGSATELASSNVAVTTDGRSAVNVTQRLSSSLNLVIQFG